MKKTTGKQSGAVSLFLVIFFALLLSVITLGFVRITTEEQQQAVTNDLSQSAFDSAEAGVEDAKRALIQYRRSCERDPTGAECNKYKNAFRADRCDTLAGPLAADLGLELDDEGAVSVQSSAQDADLNQAYTCVKIRLNTKDYTRKLEANTSDLVPIDGVANFNAVTIDWFVAKDAGLATGTPFEIPATNEGFPAAEQWGNATPPVMRVQLIQFKKAGFTQKDLEDGSSTLFLYPVQSGGAADNQVPFTRYARKSPNEPINITCTTESSGYACSAKLLLTGSLAMTNDKSAFLRITPLYKGATFQLKLNDGNVDFDGVQPLVDSTGRANDVFRRVESRIRFDEATGNYPESALETTSDICKSFVISAEVLNQGACQPSKP
ncbi:MAG TPA: hypothetical protein VD907_05285 [Verrucomicrobiae bacterium]|nr:hypothetical protein [Verrucomicrobiae bacterium]